MGDSLSCLDNLLLYVINKQSSAAFADKFPTGPGHLAEFFFSFFCGGKGGGGG